MKRKVESRKQRRGRGMGGKVLKSKSMLEKFEN